MVKLGTLNKSLHRFPKVSGPPYVKKDWVFKLFYSVHMQKDTST